MVTVKFSIEILSLQNKCVFIYIFQKKDIFLFDVQQKEYFFNKRLVYKNSHDQMKCKLIV